MVHDIISNEKNNQLTNMYSYFLCWQPAVTLLSLDQM